MSKGGRRSTSWKRGPSGNGSGRPKRAATVEAHKIIADVSELTYQALGTLQEIMEDKRAPPAARRNRGDRDSQQGLGLAGPTWRRKPEMRPKFSCPRPGELFPEVEARARERMLLEGHAIRDQSAQRNPERQ
jgi:hypothetical protein